MEIKGNTIYTIWDEWFLFVEIGYHLYIILWKAKAIEINGITLITKSDHVLKRLKVIKFNIKPSTFKTSFVEFEIDRGYQRINVN